jgi:type II secretory pathway component PulC
MKTRYFLTLIMLGIFCGCNRTPKLPTDINAVRKAPSNLKKVNVFVSRETYKNALEQQENVSSVRLVPILLANGAQTAAPEYRMFGIVTDSPAAMLGLQNTDVLIAANDYIIYEPEKFKAYLNLLAAEKEAALEIRRAGIPMKLQVQFVN